MSKKRPITPVFDFRRQWIINLRTLIEKPTKIPAETLMRVHRVTRLPVLQAKVFLENASPLFYSRFVAAVNAASINSNETIVLCDPMEKEPETQKVIENVENEVKELFRDRQHKSGFSRLFAHHKKQILKDRFGIEWFTPAEMNPGIIFD